MATRRKRAPRLRLYKRTGKGRVILNGQHFYTKADYDTPESHEEYLDLIRRWEAGERNPLREIRTPDQLDNPRTVADLAESYLDYIRRAGLYMKNGEPTGGCRVPVTSKLTAPQMQDPLCMLHSSSLAVCSVSSRVSVRRPLRP